MNYFINYFQKGVIILIMTMLLAAPNMRVYSFVGSYKTSSLAIMGNTKYKRTYIKDRLFFEAALSIGAALGVVCVGLIIGGLVYAVVTEDIGKSSLLPNRIDKNYMKYDFSQFDNQK